MTNPIAICMGCNRRNNDKCTVDGRSIHLHIVEGKCPEGLYVQSQVHAPHPIPYAQWPDWAVSISDLREPGDIGVGSTIRRKLAEGGIVFKATLRALGVACGCDSRASEYDASYPYSPR